MVAPEDGADCNRPPRFSCRTDSLSFIFWRRRLGFGLARFQQMVFPIISVSILLIISPKPGFGAHAGLREEFSNGHGWGAESIPFQRFKGIHLGMVASIFSWMRRSARRSRTSCKFSRSRLA